MPRTGIPTTGVSVVPTSPTSSDPKTQRLSNDVRSTAMSISQRYPNLTNEVSKITGKQTKPTGLLAGIFSSAPAKIIMKPLEVLSYGRTSVISGLRELTDALDSDPKTKASVGDWFKQAKNPYYGFGTAFPMKGNWGRFVGLVGDVGLDPITYLTLGTGKAASFSERLAMAPKLLDKGFGEATVSKFLARGKSALTAEQIASAGMKKTGLYMFGSKLRIPLSGPVGESMLAMGSWGKNAFTHTNVGEALQRGFMGMGKAQSTVIRDMRLALARGEAIPERVLKEVGTIGGANSREAAIRFLGASNVKDAAQGIANKEFSVLAATRLGEMGRENLQQYGGTIHQVIEGTRAAANEVEQRLANQMRSLYEEIWNNVDARFKALDPSSSIGHVPEYFPWVITDEAKAELSDLTKPWLADLRTIMEGNPLDAKGSFKSRTLKEGTEFLWTVDDNGTRVPYILKQGDLNVDSINKISRGALGVDFFKTDAVDVLGNHYVASAANHIGTLALYDDLYKSGVVRKTLDIAGPSPEMNAYLAGAADGLVVQTGNAMQDGFTAAQTAIKTFTDEINKTIPQIRRSIKEAEEGFVRAGEAKALMAADLAAVQSAVDAVVLSRKNLETVQSLWDNIYEAEIPELATASQASLEAQINTLKELEAYMAEQMAELSSNRSQLAGLRMHKDLLSKEDNILENRLMFQDLTDGARRAELDRKLIELQKQFGESQKLFEQHMELSNILNVRFEDIADGKRFKSAELNRVKQIIEGQVKLSKLERDQYAKSFTDFGVDKGAIDKWMRGKLKDQDFFKMVEKYFKAGTDNRSVFNVKDIASMTNIELQNIIASAATGISGSFDSIRAAVHILARDVKFFGDEIPASLRGLREQLVIHLEEQSKFTGFLELARTEKTSAYSAVYAVKQADDFGKFVANLESSSRIYSDVKNWREEITYALTDPNSEINLTDLVDDQFLLDEDFEVLHRMVGLEDESYAAFIDAADTIIATYDNMEFKFNSHGLAKTYRIDEVDLAKSFEETIQRNTDDYLTTANIELKFDKANLRRLIRDGNNTTNQLADSLAAYAMTSEVERRFMALGTELSMHGIIPSDEMHSLIIRKVVGAHYEKTISRQSEINIVREKMDEIRSAVETAIGLQGGGRGTFGVIEEGANPVAVFDDMLEALYLDPVTGQAMHNVMGPMLQYHSDGFRTASKFLGKQEIQKKQFESAAREWYSQYGALFGKEIPATEPKDFITTTIKPFLRTIFEDDQTVIDEIITPQNIDKVLKAVAAAQKIYGDDAVLRAGLKDFEKDHLKAWFEAAVPYQKYSRKIALQKIKTMSPTKDERSMREFFTDLLGGQRRSAASTEDKVMGRFTSKNVQLTKSPKGQLVVTKVRGKLNLEMDAISKRTLHMYNALDESVKPADFLADPFGLPTGAFTYAASLESLADNLSAQIKGLKASGEVAPIRKSAAEALNAQQRAERSALQLTETDPTANLSARSSAYRVTPEREQQLADSVRKIRARHDRFIASPAYIMAKKDQEITGMLERLIGIDGHLMRDVHTGEAGWNIDPKTPVVKLKELGFDEAGTNNLVLTVDATTETFGPDSYFISPDGTKMYSVAEGGYETLSRQFDELAREARIAFSKNPNDPFVDAANAEYNAFKTGKGWRHVTVKRVSPDDTVNVNNVYKIDVTDASLAEGGKNIIGERSIMPITDRSDIRALTTPKFATYRTPASTAERKRIADSLFAQDAITPSMHASMTSELHIGDVLSQEFRMADGTTTTLREHIKKWEYDTYARNNINKGDAQQFNSDILNNLYGNEEKLSFTQAEWESLFNTPFTPAEGAKNASAIGAARKQLEVWKNYAKSGRKFIQEEGVEGRTTVLKKIQEIEAQIEKLAFERTARTAGSQSSALEKARQLFEQFDATAGKRKAGSAVDRFTASMGDTLSPQFVRDTRKGGLSRAWTSTSSYRTIVEERTIANSPEFEAYVLQRRGVREMEKAAADASKKAREMRLGISVRENEMIDTAQQILDDAIGSGNPEIVETFKQLFEIAADDAGKPVIQSVKLDSLTQAMPRETRNLVKQIREQNASTITPFSQDAVKQQALIDAVTIDRANLFRHHLAIFADMQNPDRVALSNKLAVIRSKIGELDANELVLLRQQKDLLKKIATAEGLNQTNTANVYREYITGFSRTKKGNISTVVKDKPDVPGKISAARMEYLEATADMLDARAKYESIMPAFEDAAGAAEDAELILRPRMEQLEKLLEGKKSLGELRMQDTTFKRGTKTITKTANFDEYQSWLKEAHDALNLVSLAPDEPLNAVYAEVVRTQNNYMLSMLTRDYNKMYGDVIRAASGPNAFSGIDQVINKGYASLEKFGLKGMEAPLEVLEMFENIRRFKEPAFSRGFGKFLEGYTGFFKRYATLSPGFHVRNALGNTFALVAAGGELRNFSPGLRLYRSMRDALESGSSLDNWLSTIANPVERANAEIAARGMFAAGGGVVSDTFSQFLQKGSPLKVLEDNIATRTSRGIGARIENSARFMLGYDSAVKGLDFQSTAARIKRFLIDYEDLGQYDKAMKTIVPFWTWTSRALPMHLTNMWINPKPYAMYETFKRNFTQEDPNGLTPSWIINSGGFKITNNTYILPDLGFNKITELGAQASDPTRLLSMVNPALRVPVEVATGTKFFTGQKMTGKPADVSDNGVNSALASLLSAIGMAGTDEKGNKVANEKALYALNSLIPSIGQGERLLPSKPDQASNWLSYLGVPLREDTPALQRSALYEKLNQLNKLETGQGF